MIGKFDKLQLASLAADHFLGPQQFVFRYIVNLIQDADVSVLKLLVENRVGRTQVRRDIPRVAAGNRRAAFQAPGKKLRRVDYGQDGVELKIVADLRPGQGSHNWRGEGQTRGFDQHVIDLVCALLEHLHGGQKIVYNGAANASVWQIMDLHLTFPARAP